MRSPTSTDAAGPSAPAYGRGTGVCNPIDVHVGARIRTRRLLLGMNQQALAKTIGLTFQQVQRYESGFNRISASRLSAIAEFLGVPVDYFFAGLESPGEQMSAWERRFRELKERSETIDLVRLYYAIANPDVRAAFLSLVKTIAAAKTLDSQFS